MISFLGDPAAIEMNWTQVSGEKLLEPVITSVSFEFVFFL